MNAVEILQDIAETTRPRFDVRDLPSRERPARPQRDAHERFMSHVDRSGGPDACWTWDGATMRFHVGPGKKMTEFRRFAWESANPGTKAPRHLYASCRNTRCANPRHLSGKHPGHLVRGVVMTKNQRLGRSDVTSHETTTAALVEVIRAVHGLDETARRRVFAAVDAYFKEQG